MRTLVVGYGNPLRRDDGAGPAVIEQLAVTPGVEARTAFQLLPELADDLAGVDRVIFVDARVGTEVVEVLSLASVEQAPALGHACDPSWLLGLTRALHGRCPEAWLVTLPAFDLALGEGLSPETAKATRIARRRVEELCTNSA